jgi:hypothetical protein
LITVVLNNRDLLTWPKAMVEHIRTYAGLQEIVILDNESSYPPLLEWYSALPDGVRMASMPFNLGHKAPWTEAGQRELKTDYYVVSDPDLDLTGVPRNVLLHLSSLLRDYPDNEKVGLSLEVSDLTPDLPYFPICSRWEPSYWRAPLVDNLFRLAPIDTTFAMYNKRVMNAYKICGARTERPYTARHLPWYVRTPDPEFAYYLARANDSSSYKVNRPK